MKALPQRLFAAAVAALTFAAGGAIAQTKITVGYTGVSDFAGAFVAKEQEYFKKRGLDVELQQLTLASIVPSALMSDSIQVGAITPPVFLQAVDSKLPLVAIAGGSLTQKGLKNVAVVTRDGASIKTAQDLIGKKVGVPGLGATLHVLFRHWLREQGVDHRKITFIEVPFPRMNDVIKGGSIDAAVAVDPFLGRMIQAATAVPLSYFAEDLPDGLHATGYATTSAWATKNAAAAKAFREALAEAAEFAKKDPVATRAAMGKYLKLPPPVLASMAMPVLDAGLASKQLAFWINTMNEQGMLKTHFDLDSLVAK